MSELEVITAVVLSNLTQGVMRVASAPMAAAAAELEARIRARLSRIGRRANDRAAGRPIEATERVMHKVLTEGAFTDDEIVLEYLGGVLAASDASDAATPVVAQIGRLSAIQLRVHCIVFSEIRRARVGLPGLNLYDHREGRAAEIEIDGDELIDAFPGTRPNEVGSALAVLMREGLLAAYSLSRKEDPVRWTATAMPTGQGAELYLWGNGIQPPDAARFFDDNLEIGSVAGLPEMKTARLVHPDMPQP